MKQTLGFVFFGFLLLIALAYFVAIFFCGNLVRTAVNRMGPSILEAPVTLDEATLAPMSGKGTLTDLRIGNPAGWSQNDALRISRVQVQVQPFSVFDDPVLIEELEIESVVINYETKIVASNISDLLKNAEKSLGSGPNSAETKTADGKPIRLIVKKLVLRNASVNLSAGGQSMVIPLPEIDLVDLGVKEGGLTPPQLGFAILRSVTANVVAASTRALGTVGGTTGAAALENAKQLGEAIKGFFGAEKKK